MFCLLEMRTAELKECTWRMKTRKTRIAFIRLKVLRSYFSVSATKESVFFLLLMGWHPVQAARESDQWQEQHAERFDQISISRLSESNLIFSRETEEALRIKSAVLLIVLLTYATYQRTCTMSSCRDANQWINSLRKNAVINRSPGGNSGYIWHLNCVIDMCLCTAVCTRGNWCPGVARIRADVSDSCGTTHFEWWLVAER